MSNTNHQTSVFLELGDEIVIENKAFIITEVLLEFNKPPKLVCLSPAEFRRKSST